ncbi:MAG: ComEC/Rec2 family competence protein [Puniceicoccales bacterium]|jgi:competence protein ComEC|nr:ComEC/Rec2 family competence protein [Puniceicoccales bacterium]
MKISVNANRKKSFKNSVFEMFLPTLFFISGIRYQNVRVVSMALVICAAIVFGLAYICRRLIGENHPFGHLQLLKFSICGISLLCGALYGARKCSHSSIRWKSSPMKDISVAIVADTIKIRDERCGIFYGYGTIKWASQQCDALVGGRIFFSVQHSMCDKIPLRGQEFKVRGRLGRVSSGDGRWFTKHLINMRIEWNMQYCCLLSCDKNAPPLKEFFRTVLNKFLRSIAVGVEHMEAERGIMAGMLTGNRRNMSDFSRTMFNDLGIAHLFAVSGIHIGLIAGTIDFLMRAIGMRKKFRIIPTLFALTFYVNAIGCSPSALRALSMMAFYCTASLLGRKPNVLSALTNSALLQALCDPFVVFNISFLLSYSVVAGIILIGVPLKNFLANIFLNLHGVKLHGFSFGARVLFTVKRFLVASFSIAVASYCISLPLTMEYFGTVSLLTIPVNMIVVPIGTCAIVTGCVTLFFGLFNMWWICAALNKISCSFIYIFQILSRSMYSESFCHKNVTFTRYIGGPCMTMLMLLCAYALFAKNMHRCEPCARTEDAQNG